MMRYFWVNYTDIPAEIVTRNFSPTHITWFILSLLLVIAAVPFYRRQTLPVRIQIKKILIIVMLTIEAIAWIWKAIIGAFTLRDMLPLHLCSISIFIETYAVFGKQRPFIQDFVYAVSMPSALAAIVTPGWYYPFVSFQYLQSALLHTILMLVPALIIWGDGVRPDYRRLPKCFMLLLVFAGVAVVANELFGSNYMFLNYVPPDTTLVIFERWFGNPGYVIPEFGLVLIIWTILYLPWTLADRRRVRAEA